MLPPPPSPKIIYGALSYQVMRAVYEVHNQLGPGYTEDIYHNALIKELKALKIPFESEKLVTVCYKDEPVGTYRLDLVIEGKIILELKAVDALANAHKSQLRSYLKATGLKLGILINFGSDRVEAVRMAN